MKIEPLSLDDVEAICTSIDSCNSNTHEVRQLSRWVKKVTPLMRRLLDQYSEGVCDPKTSDELARTIDDR